MDGNAAANARQFWAFLLISYLSAVMVLQCLGKETHFSAMAQRWRNAGYSLGQSPGHPMNELHSDNHETVSLLTLEKHVTIPQLAATNNRTGKTATRAKLNAELCS